MNGIHIESSSKDLGLLVNTLDKIYFSYTGSDELKLKAIKALSTFAQYQREQHVVISNNMIHVGGSNEQTGTD